MIELNEARELLKKAVETKGRDFVYSPEGAGGIDCWYVPRPDLFLEDDPRAQTGCLVGVALDLADIKLDNPHTVQAADEVAKGAGLPSEVGQYLLVAQGWQDDGKTWGEAYDAAEDYLKRRSGEAEDLF